MSDQVQQTAFSYEALDEETRQFVQRKTDEIHGLLKRTAENIIKIGQHLQMVKERLPHGQFLSWIETEFAMSRWTAQNFMRVADKFGNIWPTRCATRSKKVEASALKGTIFLPFPHALIPFAHTLFLVFPLDTSPSIC
jgi:hypothetical protein